ncbi:MAG TPA: hypothetical protein VMW69_03050 [Spirochaetia bacterium]|nr:hypothetical protein [Spirochaetia bacterium]
MTYQCSSCGLDLADSKRSFDYDGRNQHEYYDPAGRLIPVLLFEEAPGCHLNGNMISDYTWFEGTTYRFADCIDCGAHIGWVYYYGHKRAFFALMKDALVEKPRKAPPDP